MSLIVNVITVHQVLFTIWICGRVLLINDHFQFGADKDKVVAMIYSHTQLKAKNKFMISLLDAVEKEGMHLVAPLEEKLREIGQLAS